MVSTFMKHLVDRRALVKGIFAGAAGLMVPATPAELITSERKISMSEVRHSTIRTRHVNVFYREAGAKELPVLLLLHGFANSSHYFRHLMPLLAERFRLIAPDLPSFGFTEVEEGASYQYTFAQLTETMQEFIDALGLKRFAMYVFDYGAPIGFNLAVANPGRITGIISQNGNIYEEGLGEAPWAPLRAYWKQPSQAIRDKIKSRMSLEGVRDVYLQGVRDINVIDPEAYWLDAALLARPGMMELQTDLKIDYRSNLERYPLYQSYVRTHQPPILAIWGKNDPFFLPVGAQAFQRDAPKAVVQFLDTGHFALETNVREIARAILTMAL